MARAPKSSLRHRVSYGRVDTYSDRSVAVRGRKNSRFAFNPCARVYSRVHVTGRRRRRRLNESSPWTSSPLFFKYVHTHTHQSYLETLNRRTCEKFKSLIVHGKTINVGSVNRVIFFLHDETNKEILNSKYVHT